MIFGTVCFFFQQGIKEPGDLKWGVNGIIYHLCPIAGTPHIHAAKRQVIIPGKNIQLSVLFIQVIVVSHHAGQTVHIDGKYVYRHISEKVVDIQTAFKLRSFADVL